MKKRLLYTSAVLLVLLTLMTAGILFIEFYGQKIHCPSLTLFGQLCPFCGGTRMLRALIRFDLATAFYHNPVLVILTPVLGFTAASYGVRYLRFGKLNLTRLQAVLLISSLALLLIFGVLRNFVPLGLTA